MDARMFDGFFTAMLWLAVIAAVVSLGLGVVIGWWFL